MVAPGEAVNGGGSHARGYVDPNGLEYGLSDGTVCTLYGGVAFRYWLGEPGASTLISGSVQFWEPVLEEDWEPFLGELQQEARQRVAYAMSQKVGMLVKPDAPSLVERMEWLVIPRAEPDLLDRLAAYQSGVAVSLPPGVNARDLKPRDIQRLGRQLARHRPRPRIDGTQRLERMR